MDERASDSLRLLFIRLHDCAAGRTGRHGRAEASSTSTMLHEYEWNTMAESHMRMAIWSSIPRICFPSIPLRAVSKFFDSIAWIRPQLLNVGRQYPLTSSTGRACLERECAAGVEKAMEMRRGGDKGLRSISADAKMSSEFQFSIIFTEKNYKIEER